MSTSEPSRSSSTTCCHFRDLGSTPSRTWPILHSSRAELVASSLGMQPTASASYACQLLAGGAEELLLGCELSDHSAAGSRAAANPCCASSRRERLRCPARPA